MQVALVGHILLNTRGDRQVQQTAPHGEFWKGLKPYRGKTKTNGLSGGKRRFYEWDHTHGDVEQYDSQGRHLGSVDAETGDQTKDAVPGRKIDL
ncbi:colicin E3/pyocin S6 family cytotoxin [Pelomonas caseinilytica]|uniref:colicin E3/pyocin S6 family cytotoxin n=1 Tax=Pelomonas caseinilytica TaxID=2906763 RepID=UPI003B027FFA